MSSPDPRVRSYNAFPMWQRFTKRARKLVSAAKEYAEATGADAVRPEHLLLGLLSDAESMGTRVIVALGVVPERLRQEVVSRIEARDPDPKAGEALSDEAKAAINLAVEEAKELGNDFIGTEHLLLGLIRSESVAGMALAQLGADVENARLAVLALRLAEEEEAARNPAPASEVKGGGMWQRFTERARKVVFYAQEEAQKFGEGYVSTEHLLLGLVRESDSVAARVLEKLGVSLNRIRVEVEKQLPRGDARPSQDMTLTPRAKRVIDLAYDEARNLNNNYIGTEHLLLGLIREGDGLAGRVLAKLGVELERARREVMALQDREGGATARLPETPRPPLDPWERFTLGCRRAADAAGEEARRYGQPLTSPEHLLLGVLTLIDDDAYRALRTLGIDLARLVRTVRRRCRKAKADGAGPTIFSPASNEAFALAYGEQALARREKTGTGDLLLGLLREPDGIAGRILEDAGVSAETLRETLRTHEKS